MVLSQKHAEDAPGTISDLPARLAHGDGVAIEARASASAIRGPPKEPVRIIHEELEADILTVFL